jgi:hypothetical protein
MLLGDGLAGSWSDAERVSLASVYDDGNLDAFVETSLKFVLLSGGMLCILNKLCQWVCLSDSVLCVLNKLIELVSFEGLVFEQAPRNFSVSYLAV